MEKQLNHLWIIFRETGFPHIYIWLYIYIYICWFSLCIMGSIWFEKGTLDDETNSWTSWRSPDVFHPGESWWFISGIRWVSVPWRFHGETWWIDELTMGITIPIGSMVLLYGNIYHQYTPNVRIYTIHGSYGIYKAYFLGLNFRGYPQNIWPDIW